MVCRYYEFYAVITNYLNIFFSSVGNDICESFNGK